MAGTSTVHTSLISRSTASTEALRKPSTFDSSSLTRGGMVTTPSALVPTSRTSARAVLPPEARTSASPTPRVVGTAAKMVRPAGARAAGRPNEL